METNREESSADPVEAATLGSALEGVGATSLLTAAARALETERADGLLSDPLARSLAGNEGFELLARGAMGTRASNGSPVYVVRHRFFDDFLTEITASSGIRQVVLLAAGLGRPSSNRSPLMRNPR
jgi:O-methyltransferase involved in polyketide biosynthesis